MRELEVFVERVFGGLDFQEVREDLLDVGRKHLESGEIPESLGIKQMQEEPVYRHDIYTHYPEQRLVVIDGQEITLASMEEKLLSLLENNRNRTLTFQVLCDTFAISKNNLLVRLLGLRRKINMEWGEENGKYLQTIRGLGLRLNDPGKLPPSEVLTAKDLASE